MVALLAHLPTELKPLLAADYHEVEHLPGVYQRKSAGELKQ